MVPLVDPLVEVPVEVVFHVVNVFVVSVWSVVAVRLVTVSPLSLVVASSQACPVVV